MRDVTTSLSGRQQLRPEQASVQSQVYAQPVNTMVDVGVKNQTMLQIANGLSSLVPELTQATDTLIHKQIKQDMLAGQVEQQAGNAAPTDGNAWKLHGYQQASAIARGIEYTTQIESEAAQQFNPQDPKVWEQHGDPVKAVDSFYRTKAQEAIKGMRPEYAAQFLESVEKSRLQAIERKTGEIQKFHYENKVNNLGVIAGKAVEENIVNGKLTAADHKGTFQFLQDKAVHELGIDRADASAALANVYMKMATNPDNPRPELLNFLDIPDKDGVKLSMTSVGAHMMQAREAAQRLKAQQVDFNHVATLTKIETKVNNGEDVTADLMDYTKNFPEHAKGKDAWISAKIVESGANKERLEKLKLTEGMMSPDYYAAYELDNSDLKKMIDAGDLEGADRKATEMFGKYGKEFDNKDLGKAKAEIIKRAEAQRNYQSLSLVDLPDGKEKDEAALAKMKSLEEEGTRRGMKPEEIENQKIAWLSTQGYVDSKTKAKINNGFLLSNLDPNAPPPPEFMDSVRAAENLHRMNPELYQKTVTDETRRIMQMYSSALDEGGLSPEAAYQKVVQRMTKPLHEQPLPDLRIQPKDVESLITSGGMFSKGTVPGYDKMQNQGQVLQKIISYANENYEYTGNKEKAIQDAFNRFNAQTVLIKGNAVWVGDASKYPDMEKVVDYQIKTKLGLDPETDNVTVMPTGSAGMFALMRDGRIIPKSNFMMDDVRREYHKSLDISSDTAASRWTKEIEYRKSLNPSGKTMSNWWKN